MNGQQDLPFVTGAPVEIAPWGWVAIVASVVLGFVLLITLPLPVFPANLLPAILFTGLPLLTLAWVSGGRQMALFPRLGLRDFALAVGFGLLTLIASLAVGLVLIRLAPMSANPAAAALADGGMAGIVAFLLRTAIQLVGEELLTILPLLAVLWLCLRKFHFPRRMSLSVAVLLSTAWFAAVHLPTYDWNLVQCFAGIGTARLVLTAAFLVTRNLWVSAGAHVVNDWIEFLLPVLLAHGPIDPTA